MPAPEALEEAGGAADVLLGFGAALELETTGAEEDGAGSEFPEQENTGGPGMVYDGRVW